MPSRPGCTRARATASCPATTPTTSGGDTWVADAAIEMMQQENWSGMFVTMGGIDKAAHMWGAQDDTAPQNCSTLAGTTHTRVRRRERRRPARKDPRKGQEGRRREGRQDAGRADRRPRRDVRRRTSTARRPSTRATATGTTPQRTLVSSTPDPAPPLARQGHLLQPVTRQRHILERRRQRAVLLPVDSDRGVADRSTPRRPRSGKARRTMLVDARSDRGVLARRRPLRACTEPMR